MFQPCFLIPIYNNTGTIAQVVARLEPFSLPILIVNDGSGPETVEVVDHLQANRTLVQVRHRPVNGGKGEAIKDGILWAETLGYSHAIQVDADGQHCLEDAPKFIEASRLQPEALVLGYPIFDASVPKARLYGRLLSVWLVHLETLGPVIRDPLFGFRSYPVRSTAQLVRTTRIGSRMDFDPDIAVRLRWKGLPVINIATPVSYPVGGISHFHMLRDNLRMILLHIRLGFVMIPLLPRLLVRRWGS